MKKFKIVLISLLILIIGYFGFKIFFIYYYNVDSMNVENYEDIINGLKIKNKITIKSEVLNEDEYLTFKNMKVKNDFKDFKLLENNENQDFIKYALYDENDKVKASFWMGITESYVDMFKKDVTIFGMNDKIIKNTDISDFLDKNNINSDIELFSYLQENKNNKNNIFTSIKHMKENYILNFLVAVALPEISSVTLIDGDYDGYIFNLKGDFKEVSIIKNNKRYIFTFLKLDYFTDEYIEEILNTIVID